MQICDTQIPSKLQYLALMITVSILFFSLETWHLMCAEQGKRIKQFSKDTATAIHQTCYGIVDLCRHLLATSHKYVLLGQFTTDHLEKEFGKLREGCGGTS